MDAAFRQDAFRQRVSSADLLAGTFIKTGAHETAELLGRAGLDFVVADAEHAALGISELDRIVLGARSVGLPCLVRVPALTPAACGRVLDLGAAGVVVPHVMNAETARAAVAEVRYTGRRGLSPSTRAGDYGFGVSATHAARADASVSLWCQIEDAAALDCLDEIAAVEGVDALFIGRADLAHSLSVTANAPAVAEATAAIAAAGRRHHRAVAIFLADMAEAPELLALGITVFVCGSDQSHLAAAARGIVAARGALGKFSDSPHQAENDSSP